jgi:hypothetical protein
MDTTVIYIAIGVIALAIIAILVLVVTRGEGAYRLSPLAGLAFGFVLAGILFGENRFAGYALIGVGLMLAFADIGNQWWNRRDKFG